MADVRIPQVVPWLEEAERAAVGETVAANWITEGPKAAAFSARLNDLIGVEYGVFAPNGTLALVLGLMALGIGPGDEVLVPDVTFIGSANAVLMVGATPVFVEVNRANFQIDTGLDRGSFVHPAIGYNFRITDMQAAVGLAQLDKLDDIVARKLAIMEWYRQGLAGLEAISYLSLEPGSSYLPFRMVVLCDAACNLARALKDAGVQARSFFYPMHQQPCFDYLDRTAGGPLALDDEAYPNAIHGYQHGLCLPIFPTLEEDAVGFICDVIHGHFQASARRGAA